MVDQQRNRTSGNSAPSSIWWRKIHHFNARSKFQEVSGSFNCAEKFSALVSCNRGYGSVAFYAVFSLVILTFLYAIWKIVSAHSRSGRRPGSGHSATVTKISPTVHASTSNGNSHNWLITGSPLPDSFPQGVKTMKPLQDNTPKRVSSPGMFPVSEDIQVRNRIPLPTRQIVYRIGENPVEPNPLPTWPMRNDATGNINYYPGPMDVSPVEWNSLPLSSSAVNPAVFNPYVQVPFPRNIDDSQSYPFRKSSPNPVGPGQFYSHETFSPQFPMTNLSNASPSSQFDPTPNTAPERSYGNGYYRNDNIGQALDDAPTTPSPLSSFLSEVHTNRLKSYSLKRRTKQNNSYKTRRHKKNRPSYSRHPKIKKMEERGKEESKKHHSNHNRHKHSKLKLKRIHKHHFTKKIHEVTHVRRHHMKIQQRSENHDTRIHMKMDLRHNKQNTYGIRHRARKPHKRHHSTNHRFQRHYRPHKAMRHHTKANLKSSHHGNNRVYKHLHKNLYHDTPVHERSSSRIAHKVLDYKRYRIYRRHHSVNEEIRGKWKTSYHRVRTCKTIDMFSTQGTVKISRTEHSSKKYLHTLLVCQPVRLRLKNRLRRRKNSAIKYAQLCRKKWYVTNGVIHVSRSRVKSDGVPSYVVHVCAPSYARAMKLLPTGGKTTRVWAIESDVINNMKRLDLENRQRQSSSSTHVHKHSSLRRRSGHFWNRRKKNGNRFVKLKGKYHLTSLHSYKNAKHMKGSAGKKLNIKKSNKDSRRNGSKRHHGKLRKSSTKKPTKVRGKTMDSDRAFYTRLLKVFRLAQSYDTKNRNGTQRNNIFDSLEAVLTQRKNANSTQTKKNSTARLHLIKKTIRQEIPTKKNTATTTLGSRGDLMRSPYLIENLLAKILPMVLKTINGSESATGKDSKTTSKSTTIRTTPTTGLTTTTKPTPATRVTMPSTTTYTKNGNMEDLIKNLLPLLLKKAGTTNKPTTPIPRPKPKPKQKPKPQTTPKPKPPPNHVQKKPNLKSILARLGLTGLNSNSLTDILSAKGSITALKAEKPTRRRSTAPRITTVLPAVPIQTERARPKPTPSVNTMEGQPSIRQPVSTAQSLPMQPQFPSVTQPVFPTSFPMSGPPTISSVPQTAAMQASLPAVSPVPRPISPAMPFSTQVSNSNISPYSNQLNSDPYSRNILCFGDSLTSGYYNHGRAFHPYSQRLSQLLNSDRRLHYYVKTSGKVREMAHGSMAKRLPEVLGNSSRFDWVIILGGTNDVAHVKNFGDDDSFMNQLINVWKPRITRDIELLHEISHKFGARTVLLTIPETAYEAWPQFKTLWVMRSKLNADLRDYALRSQGNVVLCDLAAKLPRHSLSPQAQALLWNDHLHLTPYGYDKMGEIVYQCLKSYLT